jgi:hypothetical protein
VLPDDVAQHAHRVGGRAAGEKIADRVGLLLVRRGLRFVGDELLEGSAFEDRSLVLQRRCRVAFHGATPPRWKGPIVASGRGGRLDSGQTAGALRRPE